MATIDEAKNELDRAACAWAAQRNGENWKRITAAAEDWARARAGKPQSGAGSSGASGFKIIFGNNKGTPIENADQKDLEYHLRVVTASVDDEAKAQYREKNIAFRDGLRIELARRAR